MEMATETGTKAYHEMTAAERLADRIARNRSIDARAAANPKVVGKKTSEIASRQKSVRTVLDKFQEIKRVQGIDAAAEFVRERKK